jgi:hypothetical protein
MKEITVKTITVGDLLRKIEKCRPYGLKDEDKINVALDFAMGDELYPNCERAWKEGVDESREN